MNSFDVIEDFLTSEDLIKYQTFAKSISRSNSIVKNDILVNEFWDKYSNKFNNINPNWIGLYPEVTITNSNRPISPHYDEKKYDENYKVLIYLNDVKNGGTVFYVDNKEVIIENKKNKLVIFNISLLHKGQDFLVEGQINKKVKKLAIGFRLKEKN